MNSILGSVLDILDEFLAWVGNSLGQFSEHYCSLETADSEHNLVSKEGSLISIIKVHGSTFLVGPEEFEKLLNGVASSLQNSLSKKGHAIQFFFQHESENITKHLEYIIGPARETSKRLGLNFNDLLNEKVEHLRNYCASESFYISLWTNSAVLTPTQLEQSNKDKAAFIQKSQIPPIRNAQNFLVTIPELRESHNSFVRSTLDDFNSVGLSCDLLEVHEACQAIRKTVDPDFTSDEWRPYLPGDKIPFREYENYQNDVSEILWPSLSQQLIPRDGENLDLRTTRIGDRIYSSVHIDLFPQNIEPFSTLFGRILDTGIPWRISFQLESDGMSSLGMKPMLASILGFSSSQNGLINQAYETLKDIDLNTDDAIVKLRVIATTWAPATNPDVLRVRSAELAKAIQGWGQCSTSEISGDSYASALSTSLGLAINTVAQPSIAPVSDVAFMLPINRPASPWDTGAVLFRSPDGKPWPYQPGSTKQTTWIDLIYARPGSGKSVLSNSINFALCLSHGIKRLPRISIIDIGPSSSGLISLIKEALPDDKKHYASYHRLRMTKSMSINPFDTQLGCRYPSPQERSFLVNFLTLLATPIGEPKAYDGITNMCGLIIDELYKNLADDGNPHRYSENISPEVDAVLKELNIQVDTHTTWWEITDTLFKNDKTHMATIAQRHAMPLLADAASICRTQTIKDLYGEIVAPTGEPLISAFGRMISSAIREYPILSYVTAFDLGEARIVSLDLDEVAKSGGEAADRQTAIMYMLARYVLAKTFYLTEDLVKDIPAFYADYHKKRILEIREDPKRLVMDEFHRTSKSQAVRDQVIVDMREGRKWKVQVALLSQSLDDFDPVMIEFATSVFIMDAGPKQAIEKSTSVFGLSDTAKLALATRVHGPRADGATFLAQFSTKQGVNTHLITSTIGPLELWAFNTTAEDARIRNALYEKIGASKARLLLAKLYPAGSATKVIEERLAKLKEESDSLIISEEQSGNVILDLINEIYEIYKNNPELTAGAEY